MKPGTTHGIGAAQVVLDLRPAACPARALTPEGRLLPVCEAGTGVRSQNRP